MTHWEELNATVWATLAPSKIHGIGVFAMRDVPRGQVIGAFSTKRFCIIESDFDKILPVIQELILDRTVFEASCFLKFDAPNAQVRLREFMNHADDANSNGIMALRDINKGEEITENYILNGKALTFGLHKLSKEHYTWLKSVV